MIMNALKLAITLIPVVFLIVVAAMPESNEFKQGVEMLIADSFYVRVLGMGRRVLSLGAMVTLFMAINDRDYALSVGMLIMQIALSVMNPIEFIWTISMLLIILLGHENREYLKWSEQSRGKEAEHIPGKQKIKKKTKDVLLVLSAIAGTIAIKMIIEMAICLFLLSTLLSACNGGAKIHSRGDVKRYIKQNYNFDDYSLSKESKEINGDYYWTVTVEGDYGCTFHVEDYYSDGFGGMFSSRHLHDDYSSNALIKLYEAYGKNDIFTLEVNEDGQWKSARLHTTFSNRAELEAALEEVKDFLEYKEKYTDNVTVCIDMDFAHKLRCQTEYQIDDGDYLENLMVYTDEVYEEAMKKYIKVCMDYRYEELLADFTQQELESAIADSGRRVAILKSDGEGKTFDCYKDLCTSRSGSGVSFGTLYEILKREGSEVKGDSWHYNFTGVDGAVYEMSYDFREAVCEGGELTYKYYYYYKDDEKIKMEYSGSNHFTEQEVEEMTGLVLKFGSLEEIMIQN